MDTKELLDVIDIIKNSELYVQRLEELKKAEKALADQQFIKATVEQANQLRDEAKLMKEEQENWLKEKEEELNKRFLKQDTELLEAKKLTRDERLKYEQLSHSLKEGLDKLSAEKSANEKMSQGLAKRNAELQKSEVDLVKREHLFRSKMKLINEIFNKDVL